MDKFSNLIIHNRKPVIMIFIVTAIISTIMMLFVNINFNMVDYLPTDAQSTKALNIMKEEFPQAIPNANVMIKYESVSQALQFKAQLQSIPGIEQVVWLDDVADIKLPIEMIDTEIAKNYIREGNLLYNVSIEEGMEQQAGDAILSLVGVEGAYMGNAPEIVAVQNAASSEVIKAVAVLVPIFLLILIISTSSWIEPILFLAAIGISILINLGTNVFLGEISFITNSVSPILQLAVTLDYAIFLLHSFEENRLKYSDVNVAMRYAIKESMSTIAASAATTLFGFLALLFMDFKIGADLGLNLAKGILLSFASVMIFLPAMTLALHKIIDRTRHREFMPSFKNINKVFSKIALPAVIIVSILIIPAYLGQSQTGFTYGNSVALENTKLKHDTVAVEEAFGKSNIIVLLIPTGNTAKEKELSKEIENLNGVVNVIAYVNQVGATLPPEFLSSDITSQFYSEKYARLIINTRTPSEGDWAFGIVENINVIAREYYGESVYSLGTSANLYDMKSIVKEDNTLTNIIAIIAIFAVLLITFRSITLPLILLLTIETAIWINLSIPYFTGQSINFIGYLVICTVQLGATVDYAILLTTRYLTNRRKMLPKQAVSISLGETFKSILVSGATLSAAGFTLYATSTNPAISGLGLLLGRGTVLSVIMVVAFLPIMLKLFDKLIQKTTYKPNFYIDEKVLEEVLEEKMITRIFKLFLTSCIAVFIVISALGSSLAEPESDFNSISELSATRIANSSKEEIVYARMTSNGEVAAVYVVNHFELFESGRVSDYGNYGAVENLTNSNPISFGNGTVSFDADAGDFYYRGDMESASLPWKFDITYYINGIQTTPENIAGKDGAFEIRIASTENKSIDSAFFSNYMLQIKLILSNELTDKVTAEGATIASSGSNKVILFTVMPNSDANLRVSATVRDFQMNGIEITAMPLVMNIELPDTDSMTGDLTKLSDAVGSLYSGLTGLSAGISKMNIGTAKLAVGSADFKEGIGSISESSPNIRNASLQIKSALDEIALAFADYNGSSSFDEIAQLPDILTQLAYGFTNISDALAAVKNGYSAAFLSLDEAIAGIPEMEISESDLAVIEMGLADPLQQQIFGELVDYYNAARVVKGVYDNLSGTIPAIEANFDEISGSLYALSTSFTDIAVQITETLANTDIASRMQELEAGLSILASSFNEFHNGLLQYTYGIDQMADGYTALDSGIGELAEGMIETETGSLQINAGMALLNENAVNLPDRVQIAIDNMLSEYDKSDFVPVSFTSSLNEDISLVQFVFMTDQIKVKEEQVEPEPTEIIDNFWSRLISLFK